MLLFVVGEYVVEGVLECVFVIDDVLWLFDVWLGKKVELLMFV